ASSKDPFAIAGWPDQSVLADERDVNDGPLRRASHLSDKRYRNDRKESQSRNCRPLGSEGAVQKAFEAKRPSRCGLRIDLRHHTPAYGSQGLFGDGLIVHQTESQFDQGLGLPQLIAILAALAAGHHMGIDAPNGFRSRQIILNIERENFLRIAAAHGRPPI